jgi:hypothetical protein
MREAFDAAIHDVAHDRLAGYADEPPQNVPVFEIELYLRRFRKQHVAETHADESQVVQRAARFRRRYTARSTPARRAARQRSRKACRSRTARRRRLRGCRASLDGFRRSIASRRIYRKLRASMLFFSRVQHYVAVVADWSFSITSTVVYSGLSARPTRNRRTYVLPDEMARTLISSSTPSFGATTEGELPRFMRSQGWPEN